MFKYITICFVLLTVAYSAPLSGQGCVAIQHFSSCNGNNLESNLLTTGSWQVAMNYRNFESFRHFRGTHEEPDRITNNTEVVNYSNAWDFTITYGISNQLYANVTLPFVLNARSSLYEHGRNERNSTFSRGLADMRVGLGYWLFDPASAPNGNVAFGLGVKLPTGNYNATDLFYNVGPEGSPQMRPVDQSIQPGDGGFGLTVDVQVYQKLVDQLYAYAGGFYLMNPRETNGIRTFRETLSPILNNEAIMSVPDQFSTRAGISYNIPKANLGLSAGIRYEGIPVEDLIGGSQGFRRPGSVFSVEPGISYMKGGISLSLTTPIAVHRNRPQSITDLETQEMTGNFRNGDAAFADYLINFNVAFSFGQASAKIAPNWNELNGN